MIVEVPSQPQRERDGLLGVLRAVVGRISSAALDLGHTATDLLLAQSGAEGRLRLDVAARGDEPELDDLRADLEQVKKELFAVADRWREREVRLRAAIEQEFGRASSYWEPSIGQPPRYEDDVYKTMRLFLASDSDTTADPTVGNEAWYEHGHFLARALRYALDQLRRYDALAAASTRRPRPFTGHGIQWREDAGRWYLGAQPLHAGHPVRLLSDYHGWIAGRCETDDGGRRAYFVFRLMEGGGDHSIELTSQHRLGWPSELE